MKKVAVITAGGTIEAIDEVRAIRNSSTGALGAKIANELKAKLGDNVEIIYVSNKYTKRPDVEHEWIETKSVFSVERVITQILTDVKVDYFIHSMAIADYTVDYVTSLESMKEDILAGKEISKIDNSSKISSDNEDMVLVLKKAPKIISLIKKLQPKVFLVGFKLLDNVSENHLFDVGFKLLRKNRCNLVLANDISLIRKGNHSGMLIYPEKKYDTFEGKEAIAENLVEIIIKRENTKHPNSISINSETQIPEIIFQEMKKTGEILYNQGILPDVEGGTYGNISIMNNNVMYITGRNVHKGMLTEDKLCKIDEVEQVNEKSVFCKVKYRGAVKPSIDTAIHDSIYKKLGIVNGAIIHIHTDNLYPGMKMTNYNYPCGTLEELDSIVSLIDENTKVIQMKKHGLLIVGETLKNCLEILSEIQSLAYMTPICIGNENHMNIWNEWINHCIEVKGQEDFIEHNCIKKFWAIEQFNNVLGLCYQSIENDCLRFVLYSSLKVRGKKIGIGEQSIDILTEIAKSENKNKLVLITKKECGVVEYYKNKMGFNTELENDILITLSKEV